MSSQSEEIHSEECIARDRCVLSRQNQEPGMTSSFDCNICLESTQDPVVTLCGHLYCWPCLYRWLKVHSISKECPVCKAGVDEEKVIPLYGNGKFDLTDPRRKAVPALSLPQRPLGQRTETLSLEERNSQNHGFNLAPAHASHSAAGHFGNMSLSTGFGRFPPMFASSLTGHPGNNSGIFSRTAHSASIERPVNIARFLRSNQQPNALLHRLFILLACFMVACLLLF